MSFNIDKIKKSKELALLLGMFAGDGCLPIKHNGEGFRAYLISFYNTNKNYVDLFSKLFCEIFKTRGTIRGRKRENKQILWEFEKYSVEIYNLINKEFEMFCGKKALNVRIPSFIIKGDSISKKNFFLGLLITDGGIKKTGEVTFHSASNELINDLKRLIHGVWGFNKEIKEYLQCERFKSYQLNLNRKESSIILSDLPTWHNLVLRGL